MKFQNKKKEVRFADSSLKRSFEDLRDGRGEEQEIYALVEKAIQVLNQDPFAGEIVKKSLIPKYYIHKYGIDNLRKYRLNKNWRLVYTLVGTELLIVSIILEWYNHKEYEKRFGF